ncbi:MAG TPA: type II CAAX endopeptidase family protein [Chthonomonadaceae bacterium]|nr:type II CAAX endopeptidase family protein [Chthonomonadaceae bacterium]
MIGVPEGGPEPPEAPAAVTPSSQGRRRIRAWHVGVALAGLLAYLLLTPFAHSASKSRLASIQRADSVLSALQITKLAYGARQEIETGAPSGKAGGSIQSKAASLEENALDRWRALAQAKTGTFGDWRRLGILLFTFHRQGGMEALLRATTARPNPALARRTGVPGQPGSNAAQESTSVAPEQERALWEALYGTAPLARQQVPALETTLAQLQLGWFAHLAAEQLYIRAGMPAEAAHARAAAESGARPVLNVQTLRVGMMLAGSLGLPVFVLYLLLRRRAQPPGRFDARQALARPRKAVFAADALLLAFVFYLGASVLIALPLLPLRAFLLSLPDALAGRWYMGLSLVLYIPVVAFSLLALRRLTAQEAPERPQPSLRAMLAALGLRSGDPPAALRTAVAAFVLVQPVIIAATALSNVLFHKFQTPPNPAILWIVAMQTPLDKLVLFLQVAVAAPIVEELMFRGMLYPALRARLGIAAGVVLSAGVFAMVHPTMPGQFFPLWTLGVALALANEWRGGNSLLPSILIHSFNNGLMLLSAFAALAS